MLQKQRSGLVLWLVLAKRLEECDFQRGLNMEREIGETFEYDDVTLKVEENNTCRGCYFSDSKIHGKTGCNNYQALSIRGMCSVYSSIDC